MINVFEIIPIDIYNFDVCVSINQTDEEILDSLKDNEGDWSIVTNINGVGRTVISDNNLTVIRLFINNKIPHDIISHEVFHAVSLILDRIGMKLEIMVSDEAYAYFIGYLTEKIYNILAKKGLN